MAFLCVVHGATGTARPSVVPPMWASHDGRRRELPGLPACADRIGAGRLRVPRPGTRGGPPVEVLRLARGRRRAGGSPRGAGPAAGRRGDMGPARRPAAGRAGVRSGGGLGPGARPAATPPVGRVRAPSVGRRLAGEAVAGGAVRGDGRRLRAAAWPAIAADAPARGRRVDHWRHRRRVRGGARRRRRARDPSPDGVSLVRRSAAHISRVAAPRSRCLYSGACSRPGLWLPGEPPR